jgi:hypothetical protein
MTIQRTLLLPGMLCLAAAAAGAQEPTAIGYPERDILSPFRNPTDVYAPPDEAFRLLRTMQSLGKSLPDRVRFEDGREVVDDPRWRDAREALGPVGLNGGYLAQIIRVHRNANERETAFYGSFHVAEVGHTIEIIAHIPGEPERRIREAMLPRAIEFLRVHIDRRFGDLPKEQQDALRQSLPEVGSPVALSRGITRAPEERDHLHTLRLVPFYQLLDRDDAFDQAQALWFLKEVFTIRRDLAIDSLEPVLPRLRQLLGTEHETVRTELLGVLRAIGPKDLGEPPADVEALRDWADRATKAMFPPIRNINNALVLLLPSPERDAVAAAATAALENSAIGDPYRGQRKDGSWFHGFRVGRVPDELVPLGIPKEAVITTLNGAPTPDAQTLLSTARTLLRTLPHPRVLFVEYVHRGENHAVEFRVM